MPTFGKSTYVQITDDVFADINNAALSRKSPASFQVDILRAESEICKLVSVKEEVELRLTAEVGEYFIQDRPPITAITTATPPVATAAAHGLSAGDIISLRGVQGITIPDGSYRLKTVATNTFSLTTFARISAIAESSSAAEITCSEDHGFSTGNSIVIDGTDIALVDATHTITVTDTNKFTIPVAVTGAEEAAYEGDGIAQKDFVGVGAGTYSYGGRYWKENEIPTTLGQILRAVAVIGEVDHKMDVVGNGVILTDRDWAWRGTDNPYSIAHVQRGGKRLLVVYPTPTDAIDVTLYGTVKISPESYYSEALTSYIHLDSDYNEAIKAYVRSKAYSFLGERDLAREEMAEFKRLVNELILSDPTPTHIDMVYD